MSRPASAATTAMAGRRNGEDRDLLALSALKGFNMEAKLEAANGRPASARNTAAHLSV